MTDPTSENGEIETDFEVGQDNIDGSLGPIGVDFHAEVSRVFHREVSHL